MRNTLLALFASSALAAQPDWVSDPVYDCVGDANQQTELEINIQGGEGSPYIQCGQ